MSITIAPTEQSARHEADFLLGDPGTLIGLDTTGFTIPAERPKRVAWDRKRHTPGVILSYGDARAVLWNVRCSGHPLTMQIVLERDLDSSSSTNCGSATIGSDLVEDGEDDQPERLPWFSIARESTVVTLSKPIDIGSLPYRKPTVFLSGRSSRDEDDDDS